MAAATATIPAGIAYGIKTIHGSMGPWDRPLLISAAVMLAHFGYSGALKFLSRR
jgi:hypothetical protein